MDLIYSIIFGVVQGITEFLPVSSTGHLVILHELWPMDLSSDLGFDVVLHGGTLLALVIYFRQEIFQYLKGFLRSFKRFDARNDIEQKLSWLIIIGTIPAALIGYFTESYVEDAFRSIWVIIIALIIGGLLFIIIEKISRKEKDLGKINGLTALFIGLAQAIALIPGVSRSGITIIAGLGAGLKRETAAKFAFLLSIPIIFGAGLKKTLDLIEAGALTNNWFIYLVGFTASLVSGYLCVKYFLKYLKNRSLAPFAYYRFILSGLLIILLMTGLLSQ